MAIPLAAAILGGAGILGGSGLLGSMGQGRRARRSEEAARGYMDRIPGELEKYLGPYRQEGQRYAPAQYREYERMRDEPNDLLEALMSRYQESPMFQHKYDKALKAARSSSAAGGIAGTRDDQEEQMRLASMLSGEDMQQYLGNVLGLRNAGMGGIENIIGRGYEASTNLAGGIGSALGQQAGFHVGQANQARSNQQSMLNALIGAGGKLLGAAAGSGGFGGDTGDTTTTTTGGPPGSFSTRGPYAPRHGGYGF